MWPETKKIILTQQGEGIPGRQRNTVTKELEGLIGPAGRGKVSVDRKVISETYTAGLLGNLTSSW